MTDYRVGRSLAVDFGNELTDSVVEKDLLDSGRVDLAKNGQHQQQFAESAFVFTWRYVGLVCLSGDVIVQDTLRLVLQPLHGHSVHDVC